MSEIYLIWSHEHGAWWRPDSAGYTVHIAAAGHYTREEALSICANARNGWQNEGAPSEIPVCHDDVLECQNRVRRAVNAGKENRRHHP